MKVSKATERKILASAGTTVQPARAKVQRPPRGMNKLEAKYARILDLAKMDGTILGWWYESVTLKLAPDCRLTPDFLVLYPGNQLEFHDTKGGFTREDSKIKIRLSAKLFPAWSFWIVRWESGEFVKERFFP